MTSTTRNYLLLIMFVAPLLNFLTGINTDLYAPSLPAIATYFRVSPALAKDTIAITMIGFSLGSIIFGIMIDTIGRRVTILVGLSIYTLASFLGVFCTHLTELMIIRFIQGMMVASASIGSRTLLVDHFSGKKLTIAITYSSLAYGIGPVIGPFLGGLLQYYFMWKINFIAYGIFGLTLGTLLFFTIKESLAVKKTFDAKKIYQKYQQVLKHRDFIIGLFILALVVVEQLSYPTIGPFVMETLFHYSALGYGDSALIVGLCYLAGTMGNRALLTRYRKKEITTMGMLLLTISLIIQYPLTSYFDFNSWTFLIPMLFMYLSLGFIFPNILTSCLTLFKKDIGIASSVQAFILTIAGGIGVAIISIIQVKHPHVVTAIYLPIIFTQLILFFRYLSPKL